MRIIKKIDMIVLFHEKKIVRNLTLETDGTDESSHG